MVRLAMCSQGWKAWANRPPDPVAWRDAVTNGSQPSPAQKKGGPSEPPPYVNSTFLPAALRHGVELV